MDEYLLFNEAANSLAKSASRALGLIRYKLKFLKECRCTMFTKLYTSYVCPIMDYSAGVWATKSYSSIEQVQFKALRYFLGVHRFAPTDVLLGDAGWTSCFTRHKLASLRLWNRLISMPPTRLTKKIFIWDLTYCQERGTWSNHILEIFRELNAVECFNEILTHDPESAYQILKENEVASWEVRRYSKPKLRYYNMYKYDYTQEDYRYLNLNIPKYHRSIFAQFRAGTLPLQVEVGR